MPLAKVLLRTLDVVRERWSNPRYEGMRLVLGKRWVETSSPRTDPEEGDEMAVSKGETGDGQQEDFRGRHK